MARKNTPATPKPTFNYLVISNDDIPDFTSHPSKASAFEEAKARSMDDNDTIYVYLLVAVVPAPSRSEMEIFHEISEH